MSHASSRHIVLPLVAAIVTLLVALAAPQTFAAAAGAGALVPVLGGVGVGFLALLARGRA